MGTVNFLFALGIIDLGELLTQDEDEEFFLFKIDDKLKEIALQTKDDMSDNGRALLDLITGSGKKFKDRDMVKAVRTAMDEGLLDDRQKARCEGVLQEYESYDDFSQDADRSSPILLAMILELIDETVEQNKRCK